ncbi:MAG: hypothetical protein M3N97_09940 [Pseudomonadota bacterium]|nr:hypothetical protein [Pseudomonadota bacterium]
MILSIAGLAVFLGVHSIAIVAAQARACLLANLGEGAWKAAPPGRFNELIAVVAGLALYGLFIAWAHVRLFGGSPLG